MVVVEEGRCKKVKLMVMMCLVFIGSGGKTIFTDQALAAIIKTLQ
jgi:hypothetical protein